MAHSTKNWTNFKCSRLLDIWYWGKKFKFKLKALMGNDIHAYRYLCMLKVSLLWKYYFSLLWNKNLKLCSGSHCSWNRCSPCLRLRSCCWVVSNPTCLHLYLIAFLLLCPIDTRSYFYSLDDFPTAHAAPTAWTCHLTLLFAWLVPTHTLNSSQSPSPKGRFLWLPSPTSTQSFRAVFLDTVS